MKGEVICFILGHYPASWQKNEEKNITVSDHIDSNGLRGPTTLEND